LGDPEHRWHEHPVVAHQRDMCRFERDVGAGRAHCDANVGRLKRHGGARAAVALMGDDLGKLPFAVGLSRASRSIIRQNLGISLGVIALLIITSVLGLVQLSWVVVLHEGSTIVVVLNALRLLGYRMR